jgi:RND superfamily putative drug exporter
VAVDYNQNDDTTQQNLGDLRRILSTSTATGPARAYITGIPATYDEINALIETNSRRAESVALPLALILLLVVFGTVPSAATPLIIALVAVPITLAILYAVALHTWTSTFVLNVASIVGLGISIDYALFMTRRFREQLALGQPAREAMALTIGTTGVATLFSGLIVMVGFAGLFLIGIPFTSSFGPAGALVVGVAVAAALSLLPALLVLLGPRVNALAVPLFGQAAYRRLRGSDGGQGFWHSWALFVMQRPISIIVTVAIVLLVAGSPIFSLSPAAYGGSALPATTESQRGQALLQAAFPQIAQQPINMVVTTRDGSSMLSAANLARLNQWP